MNGPTAAQVHCEGNVIRVDGRLVFQTVTPVLNEMKSFIARSDGALIVDLSGVERADSSALALMLETLRSAKRNGRELVYRNVPDRLMKLASISDLDTLVS